MPSQSRGPRKPIKRAPDRARRAGSCPVRTVAGKRDGNGRPQSKGADLGRVPPAAGSCHAPATAGCRVACPFGVGGWRMPGGTACPCVRRAARRTAAFRSPDRSERKPPSPKALGRPTMRVPRAPSPCRGDRDGPGIRKRRGSGNRAPGPRRCANGFGRPPLGARASRSWQPCRA